MLEMFMFYSNYSQSMKLTFKNFSRNRLWRFEWWLMTFFRTEWHWKNLISANIYLFNVNRNNRKSCKICAKLTMNTPDDVVLLSLLITLSIFHTFFFCFYCCLFRGKCLLGKDMFMILCQHYSIAFRWLEK